MPLGITNPEASELGSPSKQSRGPFVPWDLPRPPPRVETRSLGTRHNPQNGLAKHVFSYQLNDLHLRFGKPHFPRELDGSARGVSGPHSMGVVSQIVFRMAGRVVNILRRRIPSSQRFFLRHWPLATSRTKLRREPCLQVLRGRSFDAQEDGVGWQDMCEITERKAKLKRRAHFA